MRRALIFLPLIVSCGELRSTETGDEGFIIDEMPLLSVDRSVVDLGEPGPTGYDAATIILTNMGAVTSGVVTVTASTGVIATGCSRALPARTSCTITITAFPTDPGPFSGTVSIAAIPGAATPLLVSVIGMVPVPVGLFSVFPTTIDLGPVPLDIPLPPTTIMVHSREDLTDFAMIASGPDVSIDPEHTTCPRFLSAGTSCDVVFDFLANTVGNTSDAIVISARGVAVEAVTVAITANVVTGSYLTILPSTLRSFLAYAGTTRSPFTFILRNAGNISTGNLSATVTGPNAAEFLATSTCSSLAPLDDCTVSVVYQPTPDSIGTGTATLTVIDIGSLAPTTAVVEVPLMGTVDLPPV